MNKSFWLRKLMNMSNLKNTLLEGNTLGGLYLDPRFCMRKVAGKKWKAFSARKVCTFPVLPGQATLGKGEPSRKPRAQETLVTYFSGSFHQEVFERLEQVEGTAAVLGEKSWEISI